MKASPILLAFTILSTGYCFDGYVPDSTTLDMDSMPHHLDSLQQNLRSINAPSDSYQCKNGATPSLECVDPLARPTCSCSCTNGVIFNQILPMSPQKDTNRDSCELEKKKCFDREQECRAEIVSVVKDQEDAKASLKDALLREQMLETKLQAAKHEHESEKQSLSNTLAKVERGWAPSSCYKDMDGLLERADSMTRNDMTHWFCAHWCRRFTYIGIKGNQCTCADTLNKAAVKVDESQCDTPCAAHKEWSCGGRSATSIRIRY